MVNLSGSISRNCRSQSMRNGVKIHPFGGDKRWKEDKECFFWECCHLIDCSLDISWRERPFIYITLLPQFFDVAAPNAWRQKKAFSPYSDSWTDHDGGIFRWHHQFDYCTWCNGRGEETLLQLLPSFNPSQSPLPTDAKKEQFRVVKVGMRTKNGSCWELWSAKRLYLGHWRKQTTLNLIQFTCAILI